jgi:hypothetical protein
MASSPNQLGRTRTAPLVVADQARACARLPVFTGASGT